MSESRWIWVFLLTNMIARMFMWICRSSFTDATKSGQSVDNAAASAVSAMIGGTVGIPLTIASFVIVILGVCGVFK